MKIIIAHTDIGALLKATDSILGINKNEIPENIKGQATLSFLKHNFGRSFFSVCSVQELARMNEVEIPKEKQEFMQTLHCVEYAEMTQGVRDYLFATLVDLFRGNISMANVVTR